MIPYSCPIRLRDSWLPVSLEGKSQCKACSVFPDFPDPDFPRVVMSEFGWSGDDMTKMKVIQNERLREFLGTKVSFPDVLHKRPTFRLKYAMSNQIGGFFDNKYLWNKTINLLDL